MMNWPTAFVIAVAICAGGFLYNKPSDAAFGGSDIGYVRVGDREWVQYEGKKHRLCRVGGSQKTGNMACWAWVNN